MESKRLEKIPPKHRKRVEKKMLQLSKRIQEAREEQGYTQESFAEKLSVSVMTVQFIEQGRRYPSIPMLFYICDLLEIRLYK